MNIRAAVIASIPLAIIGLLLIGYWSGRGCEPVLRIPNCAGCVVTVEAPCPASTTMIAR